MSSFWNALPRRRLYTFVALAYLIFSLSLVALTIRQSQSLVGQRLPGFLVFENGTVFGLVDATWPGARAGLKMFDEVLSYDGQRFTGPKDLIDYLNRLKNPRAVRYDIRRGENAFSVDVPPQNVTQDFAFISFYIFIFAGIFNILTGALVFFLRPFTRGAFLFFIICNTIGIFEALFADMLSYQNYLAFLQVAIAFYAAVNTYSLYYILTLTHRLENLLHNRLMKTALGAFCALILVTGLAVYVLTNVQTGAFATVIYATNMLFFLAGLLAYCAAGYIYFSSRSAEKRRKLLIFMSLNVSSLSTFLVYVAHNVFFWLVPIEVVILQLNFPVAALTIVFRHNFLDLNPLPNRKLLYAVVATLAPVYFLFDFIFFVPLMHKYGVPAAWEHPIIFASVAAKVLLLVFAAHTRLIDRMFFPSTFRFRDIIRDASEDLLNHVEPEAIFHSLERLLKEHLGIERLYYFQKTLAGQFEKQALGASRVGLPDVMPDKLDATLAVADDADFFSVQDVAATRTTPRPWRDFLARHDVELALPLRFRDETFGLVLFGPKPDSVLYTAEDLTNLQSLLAACAVALANARNYQALLSVHDQLKRENSLLREEIRKSAPRNAIIGEHKGLKNVFVKIDMIRTSAISVLLYGETGTGKEVLARAIHDNSLRASGPLIKVNCAAIPENLFESELFGHEKGAFTGATERKIGLFEAANGGTLFLDEIGELPLGIQAKLLRALQEREIKRLGATEPTTVDVRIIAATNRDLEDLVRRKKFREDLYYRLNVLPIAVPPLRERQEDIEDFLAAFLRKFSTEMKKSILPPPPEDIARLKAYDWPGNVRELQNVVERSVALCRDGETVRFFNLESRPVESAGLITLGDLQQQMEKYKKALIRHAIQENRGNKTKAAKALGLHPVSLYKMIKQLGISESVN